jgi:hypothetical protein
VHAEEDASAADGLDVEAEPVRPFDPARMPARLAAE